MTFVQQIIGVIADLAGPQNTRLVLLAFAMPLIVLAERGALMANAALLGTPSAKNRLFLPRIIQKWGVVALVAFFAITSNLRDPIFDDAHYLAALIVPLRLWYMQHMLNQFKAIEPGLPWIFLWTGQVTNPEYRQALEAWLESAGKDYSVLNPFKPINVDAPGAHQN